MLVVGWGDLGSANGALGPSLINCISILNPALDTVRMEEVLIITTQTSDYVILTVLLHANYALVFGAQLTESALRKLDPREVPEYPLKILLFITEVSLENTSPKDVIYDDTDGDDVNEEEKVADEEEDEHGGEQARILMLHAVIKWLLCHIIFTPPLKKDKIAINLPPKQHQLIQNSNVVPEAVTGVQGDNILDVPPIKHIIAPLLLKLQQADDDEDNVPRFVIESVPGLGAVLVAADIRVLNGYEQGQTVADESEASFLLSLQLLLGPIVNLV